MSQSSVSERALNNVCESVDLSNCLIEKNDWVEIRIFCIAAERDLVLVVLISALITPYIL